MNARPAMIAPKKRQAAPRFAPAIPLSVAAVPYPKSPASSAPAALSKSTDLRLTHPAPTMPLPDPIPLKIQSPISNGRDSVVVQRPNPPARPFDSSRNIKYQNLTPSGFPAFFLLFYSTPEWNGFRYRTGTSAATILLASQRESFSKSNSFPFPLRTPLHRDA